MVKTYKLFIDESGLHNQGDNSNYYTMVGVIVDTVRQDEIKNGLDNIKFKYFGTTNVVLHSDEIRKNLNEFDVFEDNEELKREFHKDLFQFLRTAPFKLTTCTVDKAAVYKIGWKESTLLKKTTRVLFMDFLSYVYVAHKNGTGRIIFEASSPKKDYEYLKLFSVFSSNNFEKNFPIYTKVREKITSITFATKLNHDTETQIADLFGYAATCKMKKKKKIESFKTSSYEAKLIKILDCKTLKKPSRITNPYKKKLYREVSGYQTFPN